MTSLSEYDAVIVGGGFFGCSLALALAPHLPRILIAEREPDLLLRASFANQARVHNGYHYPRSILTAKRSAVNYPRFLEDFKHCIDRSFLHVYAIAREISKVSAYQFRKFCQNVGIAVRPAPASVAKLFNPGLIEDIVAVEECAFNAVELRKEMTRKLQNAGVEIACGCEVESLQPQSGSPTQVLFRDGTATQARFVFNCAYSQINHLLGRSGLPKLPFKYEVAELALVEMPPALKNIGVTVMDGPFFSTLPFPSRGLHTLSHVRYTPHEAWSDAQGSPDRGQLSGRRSNSAFMLKDAQKFLPAIGGARYVTSLFEVKTVLLRNEVDDGRPILCSRDHGAPGIFVIMGAKIDNIYDIIQTLQTGQFHARSFYAAHC